jgi:succinoglycan biosynthesis transport protein ExoP
LIDMNDRRTTVTRADEAYFVPRTERFSDQEGGGMRFPKYFDILRKYVRLIAWIAICGTAAVVALAFFLSPRYTAKAQLVVEESQAPRIDERLLSREEGPDQATIQTHVTALTSHDLLANVVAQLAVDPTLRDIQRRGLGSIPDLSVPGKSVLVLEELERHLHVFQEAGSHVISVAYTSKNPAEASAIANKITDYYLAAGEDRSRLAPNQAVTVLTGKIADLRTQSDALQAAVAAYQAAHGVNDASKINVIDQKLGDLNHQLSATQSELAARRARHAELLAWRGANGDWAPLLAALDAQGLVDLHSQVTAVLAGHQNYIAVIPHKGEARLQDDEASQPFRHREGDKVRPELDQALLKLSHEVRVGTAEEAAIERRLSAVQAASDDVQLRDLVTAAAEVRHRYERLVQRRDELLDDDVAAPARLLSRAAVPHRPSSPNPLLFVAPGIVAFLLIGCLVALARERLVQGIYSQSDVASVLGLRCAGLVPASRGIIPAAGTATGADIAASPLVEALRGIIVSLQLVGPRRSKSKVILVTSSVPAEGKTMLALGLAACASQMGAKVLLMDLDAGAKTDMSPAPDHSSRESTGGELVDLFARDRALIEMIPTGFGMQLDYLPVRRGPAGETSPMLFDDQMPDLLRRQRVSYDLIFIDSASVLAKADVRLLAGIADQIVYAVRWRKTRRDVARTALALLRGCGPNGADTAATISAAITRVDLKRYTRDVHAGTLS